MKKEDENEKALIATSDGTEAATDAVDGVLTEPSSSVGEQVSGPPTGTRVIRSSDDPDQQNQQPHQQQRNDVEAVFAAHDHNNNDTIRNNGEDWDEKNPAHRLSHLSLAAGSVLLSPDSNDGFASADSVGSSVSDQQLPSKNGATDAKANSDVTLVPTILGKADGDAEHLQMLDRIRVMMDSDESSIGQQQLKAQSLHKPRPSGSTTTKNRDPGLAKGIDKTASLRRKARESRFESVTTGLATKSTSARTPTASTVSTVPNVRISRTADSIDDSISFTDTMSVTHATNGPNANGFEARINSLSGLVQSLDDDDDDFRFTDGGQQMFTDEAAFSTAPESSGGISTIANSRRSAGAPQMVNLGAGSYAEPRFSLDSDEHNSYAIEEASLQPVLPNEPTLATATLVNETTAPPLLEAERRLIQQQAQQEMLDNAHRAEIVESDNSNNKQPPVVKRRHQVLMIIACLLVVGGAIIGGSIAGSRSGSDNNSQNVGSRENGGRLHDQCIDAVLISPFDNFEEEGNIFSTVGATANLDLPVCDNLAFAEVGDNPAVWFELEGTGVPIEITIRTVALFPTWMAAFGGNCEQLQCLDTIIDCQPDVSCPLTLPTSKGEKYFYLVGGDNPFSFFLNIRETTANDVCIQSMAVTTTNTADTIIEGSTTDATVDRGMLLCNEGAIEAAAMGPSVWYSVVGTGAPLHASTCKQGVDGNDGDPSAGISIYNGNCTALSCAESVAYVPCGKQNHATWPTVPGEAYFVVVSGNIEEQSRNFSLTIRESQQPNDICTMATSIALRNGVATVPVSNLHATDDGPMKDCGGTVMDMERSSWPGSFFEIEGTGSLIRLLSPCSPSGSDIGLSIYTGSCGDLQCVPGSHLQLCSTQRSGSAISRNEVAWVSAPQQKYILHVTTSNAEEELELFVQDVAENDICIMATPLDDALLNGNIVFGSTLTATLPDEYSGFCGEVPPTTSSGVWYSVTGTGAILQVDTCASQGIAENTSLADAFGAPPLDLFNVYDTQISVFSGNCGNLECTGGNDQSCGDQSSVEWFAIEGQQYFILVHGFQTDRGDFALAIGEADIPTSDNCEEVANPIDIGSSIFSATVAATVDTLEACGGFSGQGPGVWFKVVGNGRRLIATTCNTATDFNSRVSVFQGEDCDFLQCFAAEYDICDSSLSAGRQFSHGTVVFDAMQNQPYYLLIHGSDGESGFFNLRVAEAIENYYCESAQVLQVNGDAQLGSTASAPKDELQNCGAELDGIETIVSPGVWFVIHGGDHTASILTATICFDETDFAAYVAVYEGSCDSLTCLITSSERCGTRSWTATPGQDYHLYIRGYRGESGTFKLAITGLDAPENSQCSFAQGLVANTTAIGTFAGTPRQSVASCEYSFDDRYYGVWYKISGTGKNLTASTCDDVYIDRTGISVYLGDDCDNLSCMDESEYFCGLNAQVTWESEVGSEYYIFVRPQDRSSNWFRLTVGDTAMPVSMVANDKCLGAADLSINDEPTLWALHLATFDATPLCGGYRGDGPSIWFTVIGKGGILKILDSSSDTTRSVFLIFQGSCDSLTCVDVIATTRPASAAWFAEDDTRYFILVTFAREIKLEIVDVERKGSAACGRSENTRIEMEQTIVAATNIGQPVGTFTDSCFDDDTELTYTNTAALGVWFSFVGNGERVRASTCPDSDEAGAKFNTTIKVFATSDDASDGSNNDGDCSALSCLNLPSFSCEREEVVSSHDDVGALLTRSVSLDVVDWQTREGELYHIFVHGHTVTEQGIFNLKISKLAPNDVCGGAIFVASVPAIKVEGDGYPQPQIFNTTELAGPDMGAPECKKVKDSSSEAGNVFDTPGLWYRVVGSGDFLTVSTCFAELGYHAGVLDTQLHVYSQADSGTTTDADSLESASCPDTLECVVHNDDYCYTLSQATWYGEAGRNYWVLVNGYFGRNFELQDFRLTVTKREVTKHSNCNEASAMPIQVDSISYSMLPMNFAGTGIPPSGVGPPLCNMTDTAAPTNGVWFTIVGTGNIMLASTCGQDTSFSTGMHLYTATGESCVNANPSNQNSSFNCIEAAKYSFCQTDAADSPFPEWDETSPKLHQAFVRWQSERGVEYHIYVHVLDGEDEARTLDTGIFTLSVVEVPANDDCSDAVSITLDDINPVRGSTEKATLDDVDICSYFGNQRPASAPGLWYSVVVPADQAVTIALCRDYNAEITVFDIGQDINTTIPCDSLSCIITEYWPWGLGCIYANIDELDPAEVTDSGQQRTLYMLVHGQGDSYGNFDLSAIRSQQ